MYKVFLVEDEIVVREGIRNSIPWEDTPYTLTGEAPDGELALSMIQDIKPDILITDIRMPGLDGLEMIGQLNSEGNSAVFIIISAYSDFSYAQQAVRYGAADYLVKPFDPTELIIRLNSLVQNKRRENSGYTDSRSNNRRRYS